MTTLSKTQSLHGFITTLITNGHQFISNWRSEKRTKPWTQPSPSLELHDEGSHPNLNEYIVTLSSGEDIYILAANSYEAAYLALELSMDSQTDLINVEIIDGEETLFS